MYKLLRHSYANMSDLVGVLLNGKGTFLGFATVAIRTLDSPQNQRYLILRDVAPPFLALLTLREMAPPCHKSTPSSCNLTALSLHVTNLPTTRNIRN